MTCPAFKTEVREVFNADVAEVRGGGLCTVALVLPDGHELCGLLVNNHSPAIAAEYFRTWLRRHIEADREARAKA